MNFLFGRLRGRRKDTVKRASALDIKDRRFNDLRIATFASKVCSTLCADIGPAVTPLVSGVLSQIQKAYRDVQVEWLDPSCQLYMAAKYLDGSATTIICDHAVIVDTLLHFTHGSALLLRGLCLLVKLLLVGKPLFRRPLLQGLELDCHKVLGAAVHRADGTADVSAFIANDSDKSPNRIGHVLDAVLHADCGADDADLDGDDGWLDLGPRDPIRKIVC